jgi:hypothetical protein
MIYTYECTCDTTFQAELPYVDRYKVRCPRCEGTGERHWKGYIGGALRELGEPGGTLTIILQPVHWSMAHVSGIITEGECEAKYGKDWRETSGSRRKFADEPERIYSGTHSGPARRKGKSFLNQSPATDSPEVQAAREAKTVKDKIGR